MYDSEFSMHTVYMYARICIERNVYTLKNVNSTLNGV